MIDRLLALANRPGLSADLVATLRATAEELQASDGNLEPGKPSRSGPYSAEEGEVIRELSGAGCSQPVIAAATGRSLGAIRSYRQRNGLTDVGMWNAEELGRLRALAKLLEREGDVDLSAERREAKKRAQRRSGTYTDLETAIVARLWRRGFADDVIAEILCRDPGGIERHRERHGLIRIEQRTWTARELERLQKLAAKHPIPTVARKLNRTTDSIKQRLKRLPISP